MMKTRNCGEREEGSEECGVEDYYRLKVTYMATIELVLHHDQPV